MPDAFASIVDEIAEAWSRNVAWLTLRPRQAEALRQAISLTQALVAMQGDREFTTDYRTFSRRAAGDSKSLERQIKVVIALLRRLYPDAVVDEDSSDVELLAALGVERLPQPLLVGGPVSIDGQRLPSLPFVGVPPDQWRRLSVGEVNYVLTIENYTSFVRHCREVNGHGNGVVIYTGGFPARSVLHAITGVAEQTRAPVFHWGDLDPGGLRIFVCIEAALRQVGARLMPHLMTVELLSTRGQLDSRSTRALSLGAVPDSAIAELWNSMAGGGPPRELEQEELNPSLPAFAGVSYSLPS